MRLRQVVLSVMHNFSYSQLILIINEKNPETHIYARERSSTAEMVCPGLAKFE